jgi:hypothetical protein
MYEQSAGVQTLGWGSGRLMLGRRSSFLLPPSSFLAKIAGHAWRMLDSIEVTILDIGMIRPKSEIRFMAWPGTAAGRAAIYVNTAKQRW